MLSGYLYIASIVLTADVRYPTRAIYIATGLCVMSNSHISYSNETKYMHACVE